MTDMQLLSDPVTNFWKFPKMGIKCIFLMHFLPRGKGLIMSAKIVFKKSEIWHGGQMAKYFFGVK